MTSRGRIRYHGALPYFDGEELEAKPGEFMLAVGPEGVAITRCSELTDGGKRYMEGWILLSHRLVFPIAMISSVTMLIFTVIVFLFLRVSHRHLTKVNRGAEPVSAASVGDAIHLPSTSLRYSGHLRSRTTRASLMALCVISCPLMAVLTLVVVGQIGPTVIYMSNDIKYQLDTFEDPW